ncbi:hypothetical protein GCM10022419_099720 [Nonomuraea rosea]|uniref:Uncharacterized protein n=1 Tax=Nonomuraea rosea TaxID=638574 RepID=A0ABP6ZAN4_9ACTN
MTTTASIPAPMANPPTNRGMVLRGDAYSVPAAFIPQAVAKESTPATPASTIVKYVMDAFLRTGPAQ